MTYPHQPSSCPAHGRLWTIWIIHLVRPHLEPSSNHSTTTTRYLTLATGLSLDLTHYLVLHPTQPPRLRLHLHMHLPSSLCFRSVLSAYRPLHRHDILPYYYIHF